MNVAITLQKKDPRLTLCIICCNLMLVRPSNVSLLLQQLRYLCGSVLCQFHLKCLFTDNTMTKEFVSRVVCEAAHSLP